MEFAVLMKIVSFKMHFGNMKKSDINCGNCKIDCGGGAIIILFIIFIGVFK